MPVHRYKYKVFRGNNESVGFFEDESSDIFVVRKNLQARIGSEYTISEIAIGEDAGPIEDELNFLFCPYCGAELDQEDHPCPSCHRELPTNSLPKPEIEPTPKTQLNTPASWEWGASSNPEESEGSLRGQETAPQPTASLTDTGKTVPSTRHGQPRGIGGWLVFPAIGLVFGPVLGIIQIVMGIVMVKHFSPNIVKDEIFFLITAIDVIMIVAAVITSVFFFQRLRITIDWFVGLQVSSIIASTLSAFLTAAIFGGMDFATMRPILGSVIYGAIWIPYFLISQRVKNTFVR